MALRFVAVFLCCFAPRPNLSASPQGSPEREGLSELEVQHRLAAVLDTCGAGAAGSKADRDRLNACLELLQASLGVEAVDEAGATSQRTETCIGIMQGLGYTVKRLNATRDVCWAMTGINMTALGCDTLATVALEILAVALRSLVMCNLLMEVWPEQELENLADDTFKNVGDMLQTEVSMHANSPLGCLIGARLSSLREDFLSTLSPSSHTRQLVSRLMAMSRKISEYANHIVWRDMHFLWISDCLRQAEVVHSSWGPIEHWDELGANDARTRHVLGNEWGGPPAFLYSDKSGERRDILVSLLQSLYDERGHKGELFVVEVGVFRATLSRYILEKLPFVRLLGVDPYIGTDGTFPGDFSQTLSPDSAMATAQAVYDSFSSRAQLFTATSKVAALQVPDGSADAVFVDGCHLYECVVEDFDAWIPKLRAGSGALLAGHDFSPQWPGVVRAVHERRGGGQQVVLGQDWTFWWHL